MGLLGFVRNGNQGWGRKGMVLGGCVAALGMVPSAALATPGSGVTGTVLATGTSAGTMKVKAKGVTDVVVRTITIAPGGSTGWHHHPGQLIAVVQKGTLSRTLDDCSVETTTAGQSFIEPSGAKHRHIGRNLGSEPVVLYVTYMLPAGSPLSIDADAPACAAGE
ncbi:cupin domain-containing protein [Streptomyces sp. ISL-100]|uniref:cupin domain-containing protein n=1 Tax=Streptomyces sp. ISL-100 TaxID=2819173 RepID=UPI0020355432|nr:cupin domain-containing protein [Streptomyces sp. ISL-100]